MTDQESNQYLPTRRSLLTRLKSWDNQDSWREFFEAYWHLIYGVARKSGLNDAEAQDVVQETVLSVAKEMPTFKYDRERGSFKSWLRLVTRRRIADQMRKRCRAAEVGVASVVDASLDLPDPASEKLDELWETEWRAQTLALSVSRAKSQSKEEHFQIFELVVLKGWRAADVAKTLRVSLPLVYWAQHKVARIIRKEQQRMEDEMG